MHADLIDTTSDYIPLSLYYLKGYAETDPVISRRGCISIVVPKNVSDPEATAAEIISRKPDVVGFSCYIWNMVHIMDICHRIKAQTPETAIVVGGPDVSSVPEKALRNYPCIDVVVCGEGEETFRELLRYWIEAGKPMVHPHMRNIQGIAFRQGNDIILTDQRPFIENLNVIPSPYLNGAIDLEREHRTILFETYRGCPFKCSFCYYPKDYGNLLHSFSLERVEHDLKEILNSGVRSIYLMDPTFNVPPKRQKEIVRILAENRKDETLWVTVELRVDLLDREFMDLLTDAGISVIEIGLQSANEDVLRAVSRKQSLKRITENVQYLQSIDIEVVCQLIYGMPEDSYHRFIESLDFCVSLKASKIEAYRLQLLPGTPMYRNADLLGLEFIDKGDRKIIRTRTMSEADIKDAGNLAQIFQNFYNNKTARDTFLWLSRHVELSYSKLLNRYMRWRLAQDSTLECWLEEGTNHIGSFIRSFELKNIDVVLDVVNNLLRYDHYTSPIVDVTRSALIRFDYDIAALVADKTGSLPVRCDSWILFAATDRISSSLFNGRFFGKSFRLLDRGVVFGDNLILDKSMNDADITAIATWHLSQGNFDRAGQLAQEVLTRSPQEAEALHVLGQIAAETGDAEKALGYLRRAIEAAPSTAHYHITFGNVYAALGDWPTAIKAFEAAVFYEPTLVEPIFNLGVGYAETGNYDAAITAFLRVTELDPAMAMGHFSLGELLRVVDRNEEAVDAYERALQLDPELGLARENLEEAKAAARP